MKKQKISSFNLGLLLFVAMFGFTNIPNNYSILGNSAIGWFLLLALFFIPLSLIIAELSSVNIKSKSGMFGWISVGLSEKWAFLGAWSYFVANIFYLPLLASRVPVLVSWLFVDVPLDKVVDTSGQVPGVVNATNNTGLFLTLAFFVIIIVFLLSLNFGKFFNGLGKIVGWLSLFVTFLFIVLAIFSIFKTKTVANPLTISSMVPHFNATAIANFSWIIFAISGVETIGAYAGEVQNPQRILPKAIIIGCLLVILGYIIGFIGMAFILTPEQMPMAHMENMIQIMYSQVGSIWGLGLVYFKLVIFIYVIITITALVLWLRSTVTVMFEDLPKGILPKKVLDFKIHGITVFGLLFTLVMVTIVLIISSIPSTENVYTTLYDLTAIMVIFPYVLITISYIVYRFRKIQKQKMENDTDEADEKFSMTKNKNIAVVVGLFVLVIVLFGIVFSIYDISNPDIATRNSWFMFSLVTSVIFLGFGFLVYIISRILGKVKTNKQINKKVIILKKVFKK